MTDKTNIDWTLPKLQELRQAFQDALKSGSTLDDTMQFEGHTLHLGYTRYLIEYLNPLLDPLHFEG
jgi:hypothetical protein